MTVSFMKYNSIVLSILFISVISGCNRGSESAEPGVLVSAEWLQNHLQDPGLVLLHTGTAELFDTLHIPGARLIDPYAFTVNTERNRNEMPPLDSLVVLLREAGVNQDSRIVLYHEDIGLLNRTARVFLTLDHLGLGGQTAVLSGGLTAWVEHGYETTDVPSDFSPGNFKVIELKETFVTAAELDQQRWSDMQVLIDARPDEEYYGAPESEEDTVEGGHIEGAYSLSFLNLTYDDSPYLFKSDNELEQLFSRAGMDPAKVSLIYCNSGIRGSLNYLTARHLGYPALLYDGSYEEWEELGMPVTGPVLIPDKKE